MLCLHAAKHLWTRLIWLADIAETLRSQSRNQTIDYARLFSQARTLGIARILGVSFWLVKNVLQAELPKPAEEMIAADPQVPVLGSEFAERLARGAGYDFESMEYFHLILKLRERRGDRCDISGGWSGRRAWEMLRRCDYRNRFFLFIESCGWAGCCGS